MTNESAIPRKKLRVGVTSERGGINAVKSLFERNRLVVQEYDTRNDYGKDLVVDLTEGGEVTGAMIGVQVKGGKTYFDKRSGFVPARPADARLWAESTIPVIGVVWNPVGDELFWTNLTERCRALLSDWRREPPTLEHVEVIRAVHPLSDATLSDMVAKMQTYAKSTSSDAYLYLLDEDDQVRREGVFTCWTYGRADARALIMLRRLLPQLRGKSFLDGLSVLNVMASNPDTYYHDGNWIPDSVKKIAQRHLVWSAEELATMFDEHERLDVEREGWQRGGSGQMLWHVTNPLAVGGPRPFREAVDVAVRRGQLDAARRLLIAAQWRADDPLAAVLEILRAHPVLNEDDEVALIVEHLREWGELAPYS